MSESALKALITESTIPVEGKGKDLVEVRNRLHMILATNEDWAVPNTIDEERFVIFEVSERYKGNREYYSALAEACTGDKSRCFFYYLQNLELNGWHPRDEVPKTAAGQEQIEFSDKPEDKILRRWHEEGHLPGTHADYPPYDLVPFPLIRAVMRDGHKFATDKSIAKALRKVATRKPDQKMFAGMGGDGKPIFDRCISYKFLPLQQARKKFDPNAAWDDQAGWAPERDKDAPVKVLDKESGKTFDVVRKSELGDDEVPF